MSAVSNASWLVNVLGSAEAAHILTAVIGIVIAIAYTLYVVKALPKRALAD